MKEPISVISSGKVYNYWSRFSIRKSIDSFCASFDFSTGPGFFRKNQKWSIRAYDFIDIRFSDDLVLKGIVDFVDIPPNQDDPITIRGRDIASLLVDSSVTDTFSFKQTTLGEYAKKLTSKFGLYRFDGDTSVRLPSMNITPGQSVYEAILDGCRKQNQIIRNDFKGKISIDNYDLEQADDIVEGRNAKGVGYTQDVTQRYSEYTVYAQGKTKENFLNPEGSTISKDTQKDKDIYGRIYKPKIITMSSGESPGIIRKRAEYEELVARSKSIQAKADILGFRQSNGNIWDIWSKSRVVAPRIGIDELLLVSSVSYEYDDSKGTVASIEFTGLDAYRPDPYVKEKKEGDEKENEFSKALKR